MPTHVDPVFRPTKWVTKNAISALLFCIFIIMCGAYLAPDNDKIKKHFVRIFRPRFVPYN